MFAAASQTDSFVQDSLDDLKALLRIGRECPPSHASRLSSYRGEFISDKFSAAATAS